MLFGPIFRVELVTVARRRRYFLLRVVYAALALFVLWSAYSSSNLSLYGSFESSIQASQRLATSFFNAFTWMQMLAILVVGPAMAAGTIASERERRTIEYLFTTDLSNSEIVLGKAFARLLLLGQFVLVCLPILFIFRMLGGIGTQLLLCTFLLAGSTALLVTSLGVCVSVWSSKSREAINQAYGILFTVLIFPSVFGMIVGFIQPVASSEWWMEYGVPTLSYCSLINPLSLLIQATMRGGQLDLAMTAPTLFAQLFVSALLLLLAIGAVRRVHLSETTRTAKTSSKRKPSQARKARRPVGNQPIAWKEMAFHSTVLKSSFAGRFMAGLILGLLLISSVVSFVLAQWGGSMSSPSDYYGNLILQTITLGLGMLLLLATNASGMITNEKERDCWLSLMATPLTGKEILQGKLLGNLYSVRWPALVLAVAWILGVVLEPKLILSAISLFVTLLLLAWYISNLGLYFSLRSKTTMRSMGATIATVFFIGGGYMMCCCPVFSVGGGGGDKFAAIMMAPCIPVLLTHSISLFTDMNLSGGGSRETNLVIAYVAGFLFYLCLGMGIYATATSEFDSLAGRCGKVPDGQAQ